MSKQCSCCCRNSRKIKKGLWSPQEDEKLRDYITNNGVKSWTLVPLEAGLDRCGKSCRMRWLNYLRPGIKRGEFSLQEQQLIFQLQSAYGNRWSWIAKFIPGRTDNEVKNFWNARRPCKDGGPDSSSYISPYRLAAPFLLENCSNMDESETNKEEIVPEASSCRDMEPNIGCIDDTLFYDVVLKDSMDLDRMFQQIP